MLELFLSFPLSNVSEKKVLKVSGIFACVRTTDYKLKSGKIVQKPTKSRILAIKVFLPLKYFLVHYHAQKTSAGVSSACSNRRSFLPEWFYLVNTCLQTSDSNLSEFFTWRVFFVVFVSSMLFYFLPVQRNNTVLFFRFELISIPHFLCTDHGNAKLPLYTASGYSEPRRRWLFLGCPCPGPHSPDWVWLATTSDPLSLEG